MKNRSRKLTVLIGVALIATPILSAAQSASGNISNYELLQQIRNLQQEIAELRDRIDRQEYAAQQNNSNNQVINQGSGFNNSQTILPSVTSPSVVQPNVQPSNSQIGTVIEQRDLSGAVPIDQNSVQNPIPAVSTSTISQGAQVESVNTGLRVEDRVISPSQQPVATAPQVQSSSSVANPQADLLRQGDKAIQTSLQEEDLYAKGLDQLKQQQYEQAVSLFNSQLQTYPRGQRSADAYYWIGESLYILDSLDSSKKSYQSILTLFPSSKRVPNALFKMAKIEKEQGNESSAKATLQSLMARYPNSSAAARAKATLAGLL